MGALRERDKPGEKIGQDMATGLGRSWKEIKQFAKKLTPSQTQGIVIKA